MAEVILGRFYTPIEQAVDQSTTMERSILNGGRLEGVRDSRWKRRATRYEGSTLIDLFDLVADPYGWFHVAASNPAVVQSLSLRCLALTRETGARTALDGGPPPRVR